MIDRKPMIVNFYATGEFDRCVERREDEIWLRAQLANPESRLHPIWQQKNFIVEAEQPRAVTLLAGSSAELLAQADTIVLLGVEDGQAHFAVDISRLEEGVIGRFGTPMDLRAVGAVLPQREGALLAYARGLAYWHQRHRYCGACGSATEPRAAGHQRRCINPACALVQFPRTDPAVIMRITHRGKILMARQANWAPGMHSVLAGFVEPGETLEGAVAREVFEEVGLRIDDIRYFGSQPWPFPSSLMLGFAAEARDAELHINHNEIDQARWMTRAELLNSPEDETFRMPRRDSISRQLIADWLENTV
jgi:NAD+ diphosphatase